MHRSGKLLLSCHRQLACRYQINRSITSYDYIIVGSGSAGCVLANRLSENEGDSVLAIEEGPEDPWWDVTINMPGALAWNLLSSKYNWEYYTVPQKHCDNREIMWPRGRVWGGSSAINGMIYITGHRKDYDRWEVEGAKGWSFDECLPYFKKSQNYHRGDSKFTGGNGPMHITKAPVSDKIGQVLVDAGIQYGLEYNEGFNRDKKDGIGPYDWTVHEGKRWSTSLGYLKPALKRQNLSTETRALCTRVLFEGTKAVGVEIQQGENLKQIKATKEVILAGGAINSPQLLMLSGIGDESELKKHDIPVHSHLPGVGKNLQDHFGVGNPFYCTQPATRYKHTKLWRSPLIGTRWMLNKDGIGASSGLEIGAFFSTNDKVEHPDAQIHFVPVAMPQNIGLTFPYGESYNITVCTLRPNSRGTITLQSKNPRDYALMDPNYLETEEDRVDLRNAFKIVREISRQPAFDEYRGDEILTGKSVQSDADIDSYIREHGTTVYHPTSTCKMGDENDPLTVVDSRTRVKGFENLRVVDASIMPSIISGNTNGPVIMMAEKAADIIKEDNKTL